MEAMPTTSRPDRALGVMRVGTADAAAQRGLVLAPAMFWSCSSRTRRCVDTSNAAINLAARDGTAEQYSCSFRPSEVTVRGFE
eukprot:4634551-Prymnesium_polylepis.2